MAGSSGAFAMRLVVTDGPDGSRDATLELTDGVLRMVLDREGPADVTVSVAWADAAALLGGTFSAADAIAGGRVRVRGDLSVLAAGQTLLAAAGPALDGLRSATEA